MDEILEPVLAQAGQDICGANKDTVQVKVEVKLLEDLLNLHGPVEAIVLGLTSKHGVRE